LPDPTPAPLEPSQSVSAVPARSHKLGWLALGAGAAVGGGALAFDNLSSTSKDGKLTAADFLPVAGYLVALALAGYGIHDLVTP
jgi:hypothetical protein